MKPTFFERLGAYVIDIIIISLITSLVCIGLPTSNTDTEEKLMELTEQFNVGEITTDAYLDEYSDLLYDTQKDGVIQLSVSVVLTIAYFVVFQYTNKGQTLGKKLFNLRVVDKDTEKPTTIIKGLIRSLFTLSIVSGILSIIFIYVLNKNTYFTAYGIVALIELLFIFITVMFILYKKDGRGLHDIMANTTVIKEGKW